MIKTANEKWLNEQREIQNHLMYSSRTKIFVDFMKNYTNERIYIDIPNDVRPSVRFKYIILKKRFRLARLMNQ